MVVAKPFPRAGDLERELLDGAADLDRPAVAEEAAHLPQNHRNRIGGKTHPAPGIKCVGGLDQANTSRLKQILIFDAPPFEAVGAGMHQPEIPLDNLAAGRLVKLNHRRHLSIAASFRG